MVEDDFESIGPPDNCRRRRGRPKKEESYEYVVKVRLTEDQWYLLKDCEVEFDMSKSEIMREALETYHNIKIKWR